ISREHLEYIKTGSYEWQRYEELPEEMASEPRFAHLIWRKGAELENSFKSDPEYKAMPLNVAGIRKKGIELVSHSGFTDPNTVITSIYYDLNAKRISRLVRSNRAYPWLRFPVVALLERCKNYADFGIDPKQVTSRSASFREAAKEQFEKMREEILKSNPIPKDT